MPSYPSNFINGAAPGVQSVSNLTNFQELKDITVGNNESLDYLSAANYPTDANIGGPWRTAQGYGIGSSSIRDLELALINFAAAGLALTTETFSMTSTEKLVAPNFSALSFMNLQSKIEKATFELERLSEDLAKINANTAGGAVTTPPGRYPSSKNRFTNTEGGI